METDSDTPTMRGSDDDFQETDKTTYEKAQLFGSEKGVEVDLEPDKIKLDKKQGMYQITKHIYVDKLFYNIFPMEYPITSENGVAIIINIEYVRSNVDAENFTDFIQYDTRKSCDNSEVNCYLLNTKAKKISLNCQGVKVCEYFKNRNKDHCHVDFDTDFINMNKTHTRHKDKSERSCDSIFPYNSKQNTCGFVHKSSREGILKKSDCNVKFYGIIPLDRKIPYVILVCKGKHSHPPPQPKSMDPHMSNMMLELTSINLSFGPYINITADKLLSDNFIRTVIGDKDFQEIQKSLTSENELRKLLAKVQKSSFGQDLIGLHFNIWSGNLSDYIQQFEGWKCILGNLDKVQLEGFGRALSKLNHSSCLNEDLKKIYKICSSHFKKEIQNSKYSKANQNLMEELLDAPSEKIKPIFKSLKCSNEIDIEDWVDFYATNWVTALLNPSNSQINKEIWNSAPDITAKLCNENAYHDGNMTLLDAIITAKDYDKQQHSDTYNNIKKSNN
ncbi:1126_t:CDS:10, partial [Dentiscutata heterogama]